MSIIWYLMASVSGSWDLDVMANSQTNKAALRASTMCQEYNTWFNSSIVRKCVIVCSRRRSARIAAIHFASAVEILPVGQYSLLARL